MESTTTITASSTSNSSRAAVAAAHHNISTPGEAVQHYRTLLAESQKLLAKMSELEQERNEHLLVEETLQPLDPQRRAFRLVGECLVERTVGEVLPTVAANRENVSTTYSCWLIQASNAVFVLRSSSPFVLFYFCGFVSSNCFQCLTSFTAD